MSLRSMSIDIELNTDTMELVSINSAVDDIRDSAIGAGNSIEDLGSTTDDVSKGMLDRLEGVGDSMGSIGKKMSLGLTAPLMALGTAAVHTVAGFDDSMAKVRAVSGAVGEDFDNLRNLAQELGRTTAFSASQAADAMNMLALAGMDATEIMDATPGMLALASAAGMDLGQTADIVTDSMGAFGMEAAEASRAADIFAKAQASAATDVNQIGEAMKYAGASAHAAGMDLEQTSAVMAVLADTGIKGSSAGTTFNAMLRDMRKSAVDGKLSVGDMTIELYTAEGAMRDLGSVMADIETATADMNTQQRDAALGSIFMEEAIRGVNNMLTAGSDRYNELEEAMYNSEGTAEMMAAIMEDTIGGAFRAMGSAIEGFMVLIGDELKPYIQSGALFIADLAGWFGELDDGARKAIVVLGAIALAIGPILFVGSKLIGMLSPAIGMFTKVSGAVKGAGGAITLLTNPIGIATIAIGALVTAGIWLWRNWDSVTEWMGGAMDWLSEKTGINFRSIYDNVASFLGMSWDVVSVVFEYIKGTFINTLDFIVGLVTLDFGRMNEAIGNQMNLANDTIENLWGIAEEFFGSIDLFQVGKDIIQGLVSGISSMKEAAWESVKSVGEGIVSTVTGLFRTASPSRLMMDIGGDIGEGLQIGIDDSALAVAKSAQDLAEQANAGQHLTNDYSNVIPFPTPDLGEQIINNTYHDNITNIHDYITENEYSERDFIPQPDNEPVSVVSEQSGNTYNITINVNGNDDPKMTAREIKKVIEEVLEEKEARAV